MNKTNLITFFIFFLAVTILTGCSKSDKDTTKKDDTTKMDQKKTVEDQKTDAFYGTSDLKFWQNYPGKGPDNPSQDLQQVKDSLQIKKINKSIMDKSSEVYTCEMHPELLQNHSGKCPKCKMDMIKLNDFIKAEHEKKHEEMESKWEGKPNSVHKELKVPSAKCEKCENLIETALKKDGGVLDAMMDSENQTVHIFFDKTKTDLDKLEKNIIAAGFDVENKKGEIEVHKTLPDCCK